MNKKKQVLFFIGEDVTAHLIVNRVLKDMVAKGEYEPVLYFAKNTYSAVAAASPQLKEFSFFEKKLLNNTVYPFLDANPSPCALNSTPNQISEGHGFHVEQVDNINDPDFVAKIAANENVACAISIRCTQLFRKDLIGALKKHETSQKGIAVLNLHSGLLPEYRGVMTSARRIFDVATGHADHQDYGCTLHKIDPYDPNAVDKGIDTGKILVVKSIKVELDKAGRPVLSVYKAHTGLVDIASEALVNVLDEVRRGQTLRGYPQNNADSSYKTFPTQTELCEWKDEGLVLVRANDAVETLTANFSKAGTGHARRLQAVLHEDIRNYYAANCNCGVHDGGLHGLSGGCNDANVQIQTGPLAGMHVPQHAADALTWAP